MSIPVAVVGVPGYSGLELMKIILRHPAIQCAAACDLSREYVNISACYLS